jgi:predicted ATPase/DNA-binding CsgD family transcriptional regulator
MRGARIAGTVVSRRSATDVSRERTLAESNQLRIVAGGHEVDPAAARTHRRFREPEPLSPGNLPLELTSFVGRGRELSEVEDLLGRTRLLTLAGAGGSGKTRLALRAAWDLRSSFTNGAWWVDLASLSDADLVPQRVASAIGVPEVPGRRTTDLLVAHLGIKDVLLILDNCEHLIDACAELADTLLRTCPGVHLLATSREPLGVAGEVSWPVPPLSLPEPGQDPTAGDLLRFGAVRLFLERANAASPGFALTEGNASAVAALCARLDGMPLAIELAASRAKVLSPDQILSRLDYRFRLLTGSRTATPRHRTLRAAMDWSHDLLSEEEKVLFRRLSVFAGGFSLEAAEAVCAGDGIERDEVLELLSCLVDKSLVVSRGEAGDPQGEQVRYRMLETVRQYASEKLDESTERATVRDEHAHFFLDLAERAEPGLMGPEQGAWLARLEGEHDNLAAALSRLLQREEAERGLGMAGALGRFWWFGGHFAEGGTFIERFLDLPGAKARTAERARALHALGLATFWHETAAAGVDASRARFEEAAAIYRELGDERRLAVVLRDLGGYWKGAGDAERARSVLEESLALSREAKDAFGIGAAKAYLGVVAAYEGEHEEARSLLEEALALLRETGGPDELMRCLGFLGCLECDMGDPDAARARFGEMMGPDVLAALPYAAGFGLDGLARLAAAEGEATRALRLAGAAAAVHERIGTSAGPAFDDYVRRGLAPAWSALGEEDGEAAYREGRAMTLEGAMARAVEEDSSPPEDPSGLLRPREVEVLRLVAEGLADAQIAELLYLSRRTVGNYLRSAYRKLGVKSRTAAIKKAGELGLI